MTKLVELLEMGSLDLAFLVLVSDPGLGFDSDLQFPLQLHQFLLGKVCLYILLLLLAQLLVLIQHLSEW